MRSTGELGKYYGGRVGEKAQRLRAEGIQVDQERVDHRQIWRDFSGPAALLPLRGFQEEIAQIVPCDRRLADLDTSHIGGLDVSYVPGSDMAVAAFVVFDLERQVVAYQRTHRQPVGFPYIPGYLAFRELPILQGLLASVRGEQSLPDIVLVDGSGILHPRSCGLATMLGVLECLHTVGVTKKHLCGRLGAEVAGPYKARTVLQEGLPQGVVMEPTSRSSQRLFASSGAGLPLDDVMEIIRATLCGRHLPEPIYWADRLSRQAAKAAAAHGIKT